MYKYVKQEQRHEAKAIQKKQAVSNLAGISDGLKPRFERSSGLSFDDARVHYKDKPAQFQALTQAQTNQDERPEHELGSVMQQKAKPIQRMRICLNNLEKVTDSASFKRLRKVSTSGDSGDEFDRSEEIIEEKILAEMAGEKLIKADSDFAAQEGTPEDLEETEDIVFEGHGFWRLGSTIEGEHACALGQRVVKIIEKSQFKNRKNTEAPEWKGRVVLLACNTHGMVEALSKYASNGLGYDITVVGTKGAIMNLDHTDGETISVRYEDSELNPYQKTVFIEQAQKIDQAIQLLLDCIDKRSLAPDLGQALDGTPYSSAIKLLDFAEIINYKHAALPKIKAKSADSAGKKEGFDCISDDDKKKPPVDLEIARIKKELLLLSQLCIEIAVGKIDFTSPKHVKIFPKPFDDGYSKFSLIDSMPIAPDSVFINDLRVDKKS